MRRNLSREHTAGFTLVEIVVALTILALVAGTVLAILAQAGTTAADIRDTDQKDEEISRFLALLEKTVETLPVDAAIEMIPASESVSGFQEMKITNAVGAFTFGEDIGTAGELIIGLQPDDGGDISEASSVPTYQLAISRDSFSPEDTDGDGMVFGAGDEDFLTPDADGRYWLPLVTGILSAQWRYWDENNREWLEEWTEENLPPLLQFVLEDGHRPGSMSLVFETPEHLVTGDGISPDDAAENANTGNTTSSTSAVSQGRNGTASDGGNRVRSSGGRGAGSRGGKGRTGPPGGNGPRPPSNGGGNPTSGGPPSTSQ